MEKRKTVYTEPMRNQAMKFICIFLLFPLCLVFAADGRPGKAEGAMFIPQGGAVVRVAVGLGQNEAALTVRQGSYRVGDPDRDVEAWIVSAGEKLVVTPSGGSLRVAGDGAAGFAGNRLLLTPLGAETDVIQYGLRSYRGCFIVENRDGLLNVINVLDVDLYLLGVLPMEMGLVTAPEEALKAQAVVSRTYALKKKDAGASYDLVSGTSNQLYGGYGNEKSHTTAAVEATRGQVIFYDGQIIEAFFSSNSGGYTEDAENVWNEALPYAKAVPSPEDAYALEAPQDGNGYPAYTYRWQVRYTMGEMQNLIAKWNQDNPNAAINIGGLRSISAYSFAYDPSTGKITDRRNDSGRVTRLDLTGSGGSHSLFKDSLRSFLSLRSALFTVTPEGGVAVLGGAGAVVTLGQSIRESKGLGADGQPMDINPGSDSFFAATAEGVVELNKDESGLTEAWVFDGQGYGHGVGLSQWGAIGMAGSGMTYGQIIEYYYNQNRYDGRLTIRDVG